MITAFRLEKIFQPMRALESITGHMVYIQTTANRLMRLPTATCLLNSGDLGERGVRIFLRNHSCHLWIGPKAKNR